MARSFSTTLSTLRREKKISQKAAAQNLGVSQALLSHYENGIRECGLDFLCRAADFYGVTTDYLLGRSDSRHGFTGEFKIRNDLPGDENVSTLTIFRAAARMRESIVPKPDENRLDEIHLVYSLLFYRLVISEIKRRNLPRTWLPNFDEASRDLYIKLADSAAYRLLDGESSGNGDRGTSPPQCVKTLVCAAQRYILEECRREDLQLPESFICSYE